MPADHHFYHTAADGDSTEGTVYVSDNFAVSWAQGSELFIEVAEENGVPVASYGLLKGDTKAASIPRSEVLNLRNFLNVWLAFAGEGEQSV